MALQASAAHIAANDFPNSVNTDRQLIKAMFRTEGVLTPESFAPVPGVGLAINIGPGFAAVEGKEQLDQGFYFAWSEEDEDVFWVSPDSQPRVDTLILRIADAQYGTVAGSQGASWEIVTGLPAASPVARTDAEINTNYDIPGAWMAVLDLRVDPGDTTFTPGDIMDRRKPSGKTSSGTSTMRAQINTAQLQKGFTFFNTTTNELQIWDGDSWEVVWATTSVNNLRKLGAGGQRVYRQDYPGGTTDASGFLTVNHTAPFTPTVVTVASRAPGTSFALFHGSDTYTSNQARLRFMNASTGGAYSGPTLAFTAFYWE